MNLIQALENPLDGKIAITRPHLLAERGVYMLYQGPDRPLKQCWLGRPGLAIPWTPSIRDLQADDWMFVSREWVEINGTKNDA